MDLETLPNEVYELLPVDNLGDAVGINRSRSLVGSSETCDIVLKDSTISGVHAILEIKGNNFKLYDMNSENGSYINNEKIVVQNFKLGDELKFGGKQYIFQEFKEEDVPPPILDMLSEKKTNSDLPTMPKSFSLDVDTNDNIPYLIYPLAKDTKAEFSEYIFEDVESLYPIFNYNLDLESVEVIIMFKNRIYSVDYISLKENYNYYLSGKSDDKNSLEYAYLGKNEKLPFIHVNNQDVVVETIPGYKCTNIGGDRPIESDAGLNVSLGENCILCMSQNDLQVFIRRSSAPPNVRSAPFLRRDPELKRNIIVTLAIVALFLLTTSLFEVNNELEKEKAPERIATILYKKPAVTKAIAKTRKRNKKVVQKSSKKRNQESKKSNKISKIKTKVNKKKTKAKVKVAGLKSSNKIKKVKKATPRKGKVNKKLQVVRKKSKSSGANSTRKTVSKRRSNIKNAKGSIDTYKSVNFKSTISNLMAKGGSTKSLQVAKDTVEDSGDTSITGSESSTLKRAKVSQNIGSLSGAASGTLDSKKGVSGLVDKKSIYTAGLPFKTVILGGMDPDTIRKILIDHIPQFRYCYQKVLDRAQKEFQGIVKLDFVIGASGHVTKAAADSVEQMPFEVQGCVVNVLKGIRFPEPLGGGIVEVSQPMNFYPKLK